MGRKSLPSSTGVVARPYPTKRKKAIGRSYVKDLAGQVFGRLTVDSRGPNLGKHAQWFCVCSCGTACLVAAPSLTTKGSGKSRSCGCLRRERSADAMNRRVRMPCGWGCGAALCVSEMPEHFRDCPRRPATSEASGQDAPTAKPDKQKEDNAP